jgi:futalosine hydrolase
VNTLTSSESALEYRAKFFGAQVEAMEAAAAFQISQTLGAQIFEVRAISNFTGDMDKNRWNFKQSLLSLKNNVLLPMWENVK